MRGAHWLHSFAVTRASVRVVRMLLVAAAVAARLTAQSPQGPTPTVAPTTVAAAGASVQPGQPADTRPPGHEEEAGTLRWGETVVWFRATDSGTVLVFASSGYRDPFAHATLLSADEADQWASLADRLVSSPAGLPSDTGRVMLGAGDLVVAPVANAGGAVLIVHLGATRADVVTATLLPDAASAAAADLRNAARLARHLHSLAVAAAAAAVIPAPTLAPALAPAPPARASAPVTTVAAVAPVSDVAADHSLPAPSRSAVSPVAAATVHAAARRQAPVRPQSAVPASAKDSATPSVVAASVRTSTPPVFAHASVTSVQATHPAAAKSGHRATAPPADASPPAKGVDDATVVNLVHQWQPELMYCYTEYGVRTHPDLTGAVVVRVVLSADGAVGHAAIDHHAWTGDGGAAVEDCIRSRVAAWRFPPAGAGSVHVFTLDFAHQA